MIAPGGFPSTSKSNGPVVTKLLPWWHPSTSAEKAGLLAPSEHRSGNRPVCGRQDSRWPHARKSKADIEDAIPVVKLDSSVNAKLKEFHGINVPLDEIGVNGLAISAVRINGEASQPPGVAAKLAVKRPVIRVDLLALENELIPPVKIEMPIG